jgi:transcriptional regulator GlxA family with amidase domain
VNHFDRRLRKHFRITARKYPASARINAACQILASSKPEVAAIAVQTGLDDRSHFTKQFSKLKGGTRLSTGEITTGIIQPGRSCNAEFLQ